MIYVGIDDTDTLETRGTNQLARQLVRQVAPDYACVWIVRHQLLFDRRVPYTSKNGSASIVLEPRTPNFDIGTLAVRLESTMRAEFVPGSDPGLCIASVVPPEVTAFGHRCQQDIVAQHEAHELAMRHNILLRGLGGTCGGVIGALAAVGLARQANDGRVVQLGQCDDDLSGVQPIAALQALGVDVRRLLDDQSITAGEVDVGKKLRPNLRGGHFVLFVESNFPAAKSCAWRAVKLL